MMTTEEPEEDRPDTASEEEATGGCCGCCGNSGGGHVGWRCRMESVRRSKRLLVASVFLVLMFDGILFTAVVPVLPSYLHDLEKPNRSRPHPKPWSGGGGPNIGDPPFWTGNGYEAPPTGGRNHDALMQEWLESTPINVSYLWTDWELAYNNWSYLPNLTDLSEEDYDLWHSEEYPDGSSSSSEDEMSRSRSSGDGVFNYQREAGRIGWLFASKAGIQLIFNPIIGTIINRYGHGMVVMVTGVVILLTSSLLFAFGESYAVLFAGRAVHGLGTSCISIAGMTLMAQSYTEDKKRSEAMGVALGGMALGILLGYPYGGFMFEFFGKTSLFFFVAMLLVVLIVFLLCIVSDHGSQNDGVQFYGEASLLVLLKDPYILLAAGAMLFPEMSMALIEPTLPPWMSDNLHPRKWQLGTVFVPDSVGFFIGCNTFGFVSYRIGRWLAAMLCLILMAVSLFCIPLATAVSHLILPHFGLGLALGAIDASIFPLLAHLVDTRHVAVYGAVFSIAQVSISLGFAIGPVAGGLLVEKIGFSWLLRGMALLNLAYVPLCFFLRSPATKEENTAILMRENGLKQLSDLYTSNPEAGGGGGGGSGGGGGTGGGGYSYKLIDED